MISESTRIWLAFTVLISLTVIALLLSGCTSTQLASYERTVDSRSVEGYAKDTGVGAKYTVHYR